jgi:hypothetical protein
MLLTIMFISFGKKQVSIKRSDIIRSFAEHFIATAQSGGIPKWSIQLVLERKTKRGFVFGYDEWISNITSTFLDKRDGKRICVEREASSQ